MFVTKRKYKELNKKYNILQLENLKLGRCVEELDNYKKTTEEKLGYNEKIIEALSKELCKERMALSKIKIKLEKQLNKEQEYLKQIKELNKTNLTENVIEIQTKPTKKTKVVAIINSEDRIIVDKKQIAKDITEEVLVEPLKPKKTKNKKGIKANV